MTRFTLKPSVKLFEEDRFLFQWAPRSLDEDVVDSPATAVHRYPHPCLAQLGDPGRSSELRALIRTHDLGWTEPGDGIPQNLDTEVAVHRVA